MAKNIPFDNIAHAKAFIEKFGIGDKHLPIDQFDMFIIDRGLAQDPGTSDVKENAYKGFIQQRGAARRLLNTAGTWINGSSFQLVVNGRGENYSVKPWAVDANEYARQITDQVETFVQSRMANLKSAHKKTEALLGIDGNHEDADLHLSQQLLASMVGHGITMQSKIAGLLKQYDTAYAAVLENLNRAQLEDQSE
jgi:hypothetical protein